jgi:hypothetical protein
MHVPQDRSIGGEMDNQSFWHALATPLPKLAMHICVVDHYNNLYKLVLLSTFYSDRTLCMRSLLVTI